MASRRIRARRPRSTGARSCHGPGKAHVDDDDKGHINKFPKMNARDASAVCVTCHNKGDHALWAGSTHDSQERRLHHLPLGALAGLREGATEGG